MQRYSLSAPLILLPLLISVECHAKPERIRVINDTMITIYVHKGGFAPSQKILPGRWRYFHFPFSVIPPNTKTAVTTHHLVATAGGKWLTTSNGLTYLSQPRMQICLNKKQINAPKHSKDLTWTIQHAHSKHKDCPIHPYKQAWWQPATE